MQQPSTSGGNDEPSPLFPDTLWPLVLEAKASDPAKAEAALARLCEIYRNPIVNWLRGKGRKEDAEDLANTFVAHFFLVRNHLVNFQKKENAKFRSFLKKCLRRFVRDELEKGEGEPPAPLDENDLPQQSEIERQLDLDVARVIHQRVIENLAQHDGVRFAELRRFLFGQDRLISYSEAAARLGMSEGAVKVAVLRLREKYYDLFRAEVVQIARPEELDAETRYLLGLVSEVE